MLKSNIWRRWLRGLIPSSNIQRRWLDFPNISSAKDKKRCFRRRGLHYGCSNEGTYQGSVPWTKDKIVLEKFNRGRKRVVEPRLLEEWLLWLRTEMASIGNLVQNVRYINGSCAKVFVWFWSNTFLCVTCMCKWVKIACDRFEVWVGGPYCNFGSSKDYLGVYDMFNRVKGRTYEVNLICFPMKELDIILGMN